MNQSDVLRHTTMTKAQLEYLVRQGVIPRRGRKGRHTEYPDESAVLGFLAEQLDRHGLSPRQMRAIVVNLRHKLAPVPEHMRLTALFVRAVQMMDALVLIMGAGPDWSEWRTKAEALVVRWNSRVEPLDAEILALLSGDQS